MVIPQLVPTEEATSLLEGRMVQHGLEVGRLSLKPPLLCDEVP